MKDGGSSSYITVDPPTVASNQKCQKHEGQLIHSYLVQKVKKRDLKDFKHTLLCTQCIYEKELTLSQIDVIPQVMREIKQKIQEVKTLIFYRKFQLQQTQQYFQRIQQGNRSIIHNKMKEHFSKLRQILDTYEEQSEKQLTELLQKQDERLSDIQDQIVN